MAGRPLKRGRVEHFRSVKIKDLKLSGKPDCWYWSATKSSLEVVAVAGGYGTRSMFLCPICHQTRAVIHEVRGHAGCRECFGLHYETSTMARIPKMWRRREKIEGQIAVLNKKLKAIDQRMFSAS